MKKLLLLFSIVVVMTCATANAGMVPGTIKEGSYTDNVFCNPSYPEYRPTSGTYSCSTYKECRTSGCGVQTYNSCTTPGCGVRTSSQPITNASGAVIGWTPVVYNSCENWACGIRSYYSCSNSACGCATYSSSPTGSFTLTDYTNASKVPYFSSFSSNRKLTNDLSKHCYANAYVSRALQNPSFGTWSCPEVSCSPSSITTRYGGESAQCQNGASTDELIVSLTQDGGVVPSNPTHSGISGQTCTVEGRYATPDDSGPSIAPNSIANVLDMDADNWCNMKKYTASDYTTTASPELKGCKYYKDRGSHTNGADKHPDLFEGLDIAIGTDSAGISRVKVELGKCTADYTFTSDNSILNSMTAASGVKSMYTAGFTIKYNTSFTAGGTSQQSLLNKMGVNRLDECLLEGKNYLRVQAVDSARSDADGVAFVGNTSDYISGRGTANYSNTSTSTFTVDGSTSSVATIKIDNTGAKIGLTGQAKKLGDSNATDACSVGGTTKDGLWKNYTISGALLSGDPFGADAVDCSPKCNSLTGTGMKCATSPTKGNIPATPSVTNHLQWIAPGGVNPTTGAFTGYTCDGLGPIPDQNSCDWDCEAGYSYDPATKSCVKSSNLFILFDEGTSEASGPYAAKLSDDPVSSHGLLKQKDAACPPVSNGTNSGSLNFKYSAGASYVFPLDPPTPTFPIVENGPGVCSMSCNTGYYRTGDTCTKIQSTKFRTRSCMLQSQNGPTFGYQDLGAINDIDMCGGVITDGTWKNFKKGEIWQNNTGNWWRCDAEPETSVDINQPLPDSLCPKSVATCSDGIQNQGEEKVDCGGPNCSACAVTSCMSDYVISGNSCIERTYTYNLVSTQEGITFLASQISDGYYFDLKSYPYVGTWGSKWCELIQGEGESSIPTNTQSSFTITRAQLPSFPAPSQMNVVFKWYGGRANGSWNCNAHNDFAYFDIGTYVLAN